MDAMRQVDAVIRERLSSDVALINQIGHYIISAGGKRIRPRLCCCLPSARFPARQQLRTRSHRRVHPHRDPAARRRGGRVVAAAGPPDSQRAFGNAASVLVGDFLYSRAFQMMVSVNRHAGARGPWPTPPT
jgi:octaprenyl-diphosphate synthase